jgi:hypothetical protein
MQGSAESCTTVHARGIFIHHHLALHLYSIFNCNIDEFNATASPSAAVTGHSEDADEIYDAWKVAKVRLSSSLDEAELKIFDNATLENLFYSSSNVNREDQKSSKTRPALEKMQPLLSAISDYGKAMDVFSNIAPLYLGPIWGGIRVILTIATT